MLGKAIIPKALGWMQWVARNPSTPAKPNCSLGFDFKLDFRLYSLNDCLWIVVLKYSSFLPGCCHEALLQRENWGWEQAALLEMPHFCLMCMLLVCLLSVFCKENSPMPQDGSACGRFCRRGWNISPAKCIREAGASTSHLPLYLLPEHNESPCWVGNSLFFSQLLLCAWQSSVRQEGNGGQMNQTKFRQQSSNTRLANVYILLRVDLLPKAKQFPSMFIFHYACVGCPYQVMAPNEGIQELSYQCWHEGDGKSVVGRQGQHLGDTASLFYLKLWFATAPKGFYFRKVLLWPDSIVSFPSAAQVWFDTSLEPGCAAGCSEACSNPAPILMHQLYLEETSTSCTSFGVTLIFHATWNKNPLSLVLLCRSVQLIFFQWPWGNSHFHTHCPRREEEAVKTTWLLGDARAELRFPSLGHHRSLHCSPSKGQTLFQVPLSPFSWGF